MAYREFRSQRLRHWRTSIDGLSCLAFSVGRFQPARLPESEECFVDMPLIFPPTQSTAHVEPSRAPPPGASWPRSKRERRRGGHFRSGRLREAISTYRISASRGKCLNGHPEPVIGATMRGTTTEPTLLDPKRTS